MAMTKSHPWRSLTLKQIYANTVALKRIRKEMEADLEELNKMEALQDRVDFAIENGELI